MSSFICGGNCDCADNECNGNPDKENVILVLKRNKAYLASVANALDIIKQWDLDKIKDALGKLDKDKGHSLRIALVAGRKEVPISNIIDILGQDESVRRLKNPYLTYSLY